MSNEKTSRKFKNSFGAEILFFGFILTLALTLPSMAIASEIVSIIMFLIIMLFHSIRIWISLDNKLSLIFAAVNLYFVVSLFGNSMNLNFYVSITIYLISLIIIITEMSIRKAKKKKQADI